MTAAAADSVTPESCSPGIDVAYTLVSADGAIDQTIYTTEAVLADGTFRYPLTLLLDARRLLEAGVAPELPDLLDRAPILTLDLGRTDSGYADGEIHVRTDRDDLALAIVSFGSSP